MDTTLTSREGKTIDVTLTGRSEDKVFFINKANGRHYDLKTDRLSPKDMLKTKKLPLHTPPDPEKQAEQKKHTEKLSRYIDFRKREIERLERSLADKNQELDKFANGPATKQRQLGKDIDTLENEIEKLRNEIERAENGGDF